MTFATEKEKQASERFMLISIGARMDRTGDQTLFSGTVYRIPVHKKPTGFSVLNYNATPPAVYYESAPYTEVSYDMPLANEWYYDAAGGYIHYRLGGFDLRYFIAFTEYLTGGIRREAPYPPTGAGPNVSWSPLITKYPVVTKSISDITVGVLSQSLSNIEFINENDFFNIYLGKNATILEQQVKIWIGINSIADVKLLFTGKAATVSISGAVCSLSVIDPTAALNTPATWGLGVNGVTLSNSTYLPYVTVTLAEDNGTLLPRYFTRRNRHYFETPGLVYPTGDSVLKFDKLFCLDYNPSVGSTVNRSWSWGFLKQDLSEVSNNMAVQIQGVGAISATIGDGGQTRYFNVASTTNMYAGNPCAWESGGIRRGLIVNTAATTYLGNPYNLTIITDTVGDNVATTGSTFYAFPAMTVYIKSGGLTKWAHYGRDFTYSISNDDGDFALLFVNNFETNFPGFFTSTYLNPNSDSVHHYTHFSGPLGHADVLKSLIEAAGLQTNAASFTAAAAALTVDVCFQIPNIGESSVGTYSDYAAKILESTGGYLTLNVDNEVEYKLFSAPSSAVAIDESVFSDVSLNMEYQDLYNEIVATNAGFKNDSLINTSQIGDENLFTASNVKTRWLNNIVRTKVIVHVLESMSNTISRVLWLNSNRQARISFKTATKNIDSKPGDDVELVGSPLPGGASSLDVKIITTAISCESTTIEAIDLADY